MSVSSGNLDALLNTTYAAENLGGIAVQSTTLATDKSLVTVNVTATGGPGLGVSYGIGETLKVAAINDTANTITVVDFLNGTPLFQFTYFALGFSANSILLSGNNSMTIGILAGAGNSVDIYLGALESSPIPAGTAVTFSAGGTYTAGPACYCPGTMIRTDRGDIAIEHLAIGDRVVTHRGTTAPIRWIGRRSYAGRFLRGRPELLPVRIKAGALPNALPYQDLIVSPTHALLLDGYLVPAFELLNGTTIVREPVAERVDYLHVELADHDIIFANGANAETFVDDDSRAMFANAAEYYALYPEALPKAAAYCAPRLGEGYRLEMIRARLAA